MSGSKIPKLKARLQKIFDLLDPRLPLWDIGCDHGLLGRRGIFENRFSSYHFVEPSPPAMNSLKKHFSDLSTTQKIEFLQSPGESLDWTKVSGNIVIAGMGARTIVKILESAFLAKPQKPMHFVVSPQWSLSILTAFLKEQGFSDPQTHIIREGKRLRTIFGPITFS